MIIIAYVEHMYYAAEQNQVCVLLALLLCAADVEKGIQFARYMKTYHDGNWGNS